MTIAFSYDVIVAGGGPAGSTAAAVLAQGGCRVLLLERDGKARFKIGESLMPATYSTFERIGMLDALRQSHFPEKHSVQFFAKSGRASAPFYFRDERDDDSARTWQVLRSEFDEMLFRNAEERGAECHRGASVREILADGNRARGVRVELADGESREIAARVVVDATGQSVLAAKAFGLVKLGYDLTHASIFTHFEGAIRDEGIDEGATLILHTRDADSWFWFIPLPRDVASVGVVGGVDYLIKDRGTTPDATFYEEVEKCPEIARRIAGAKRVRPVSVIRDFSYRFDRMAGDGWVIVGDAFSFIDPVYSSGVFLALKTGEMAADAILGGLEHDDLSSEQLGRFRPRLMHGVEAVRRLVQAFYCKEFSFGSFLKRYPHHQRAVTQILIGDVFERDFDGLFSSMKEMLQEPGSSAESTEERVERRA